MTDRENPTVLTVDIGSSSVRCLAFHVSGKRVAGSLKRSSLKLRYTPEGYAEVDPEQLLHKTAGVLGKTLAALGSKAESLAGVAISCFWHSLVGLDRQGKPLTPVLMWADLRSFRQAVRLRRILKEGPYRARTGCYLHPSFLPSKLLWLRENSPLVFGRVFRWVSVDGYLLGRLQGEYGMSPSMAAGTGIFNQERADWDDVTLDVLGVSRERLPRLRPWARARKGLRKEFRDLPAPLHRVPIYPALPDGYCAQLGSVGGQTGRAALTLGTSGALRVLVEGKCPPAVPKGLWCYRVEEAQYLVGGAVNNVGNLLVWMQETLGFSSNRDSMEGGHGKKPTPVPGSHGLTVLPFLQGERSPQWPLEAFGVVSGLKSSTTAGEIRQAFLESLGYPFARILRLLDKGSLVQDAFIRVSGGIRSRELLETLCDILERPLQVLAEREVSALGAAFRVFMHLGKGPLNKELTGPRLHHVEPRRDFAQLYRQEAGKQEALYRLYRKGGYFF